jgi:hypothetical protein
MREPLGCRLQPRWSVLRKIAGHGYVSMRFQLGAAITLRSCFDTAVQLNERSRTYQVYGAVLLGISPKVANRTCSSRWYAEHWHSDDRFKSSGAWRTKKTQKEDLKTARVRGNEVKLRPKRLIVNFGHPGLIIPPEGTTRGYAATLRGCHGPECFLLFICQLGK